MHRCGRGIPEGANWQNLALPQRVQLFLVEYRSNARLAVTGARRFAPHPNVLV